MGRFEQRPHYLPDELDAECEQVIQSFLQKRYGHVEFPVSTDDLTILIETVVDDLDMYADLSNEKGDVEGVTDFLKGKRPRVRISRTLSEADYMQNRLRTTLTHEFAHVRFHGFMFEIGPSTIPLFPVKAESHSNRCKKENIVGAKQTDWMEWQAGYGCGALLMPITTLRETVRKFAKENKLVKTRCAADSAEGKGIIASVAASFQVSKDAARVRLLQQKILAGEGVILGKSLFT